MGSEEGDERDKSVTTGAVKCFIHTHTDRQTQCRATTAASTALRSNPPSHSAGSSLAFSLSECYRRAKRDLQPREETQIQEATFEFLCFLMRKPR
ncbi:hypothetical protein chiPu_0014959 [Chiloscyllium punctatum]|uniref:Uncharacterized protein n=1 Tax=Chiloscyllium punctatum TaxID=137246 RepID=A0A401T1F3_CHIPU|nr:hypothetical protein [Chiloscyllium punctatum]